MPGFLFLACNRNNSCLRLYRIPPCRCRRSAPDHRAGPRPSRRARAGPRCTGIVAGCAGSGRGAADAGRRSRAEEPVPWRRQEARAARIIASCPISHPRPANSVVLPAMPHRTAADKQASKRLKMADNYIKAVSQEDHRSIRRHHVGPEGQTASEEDQRIIRGQVGPQFDPHVVDDFFAVKDELARSYRRAGPDGPH